jgi:hypothetical protein
MLVKRHREKGAVARKQHSYANVYEIQRKARRCGYTATDQRSQALVKRGLGS